MIRTCAFRSFILAGLSLISGAATASFLIYAQVQAGGTGGWGRLGLPLLTLLAIVMNFIQTMFYWGVGVVCLRIERMGRELDREVDLVRRLHQKVGRLMPPTAPPAKA